MSKYVLTNESIEFNERKLYRIKAIKSFSSVREGDLGGYIESESNLSQKGTCWVYHRAKVYGEAKVYGKAQIYGEALVCGEVRVFGKARVYDRAQVWGRAEVYGEAQVYDSARVHVEARVYGKAQLYGKAQAYGKAKVYGNAYVYGKAQVFGKAKATTLVQHCVLYKHDITMSDTHIAIGCENHTYEHWKNNITQIGKKHNYSKKEIKAIKYILNGLYIMRREKK